MIYHKVCKDCVINNDCNFQDMNSVEDCEDYRDWNIQEYKKINKKIKKS